MLIDDNGKIMPIKHAKNTNWVKSLKGYFGSNVKHVYNYLYFVYSKNSYIRHLNHIERKEYAFEEHFELLEYSNWQELESELVVKEAIDLYMKVMRTDNERTLYDYETRVDDLNKELMSINDVGEVKENLQIIELFQKQIDKLKVKIMEDDADNVKPVGITMFEIPDDKIQLL